MISAIAVPFLALSRKQHAPADTSASEADAVDAPEGDVAREPRDGIGPARRPHEWRS